MTTEVSQNADSRATAPPVEKAGEPGRPQRKLVQVVLVLVVTGCFVLGWRMISGKAKAHIPEEKARKAVVAVARVVRENLYNEVPIPAEFRPYLQVDLHAKVSGFVDQIKVDIGDRVKAGQLLASLEVPELQAELDQSMAAEKRAQVDYKEAHLVYTRLLSVEKDHPNLVAQQELDAAEAKDGAAAATMAATKAEREKYQTLLAYTRITAPFDGVVTRRYADPGSLIQAGTTSDTQSMPLVRLSDNYRLRLDFPVSVSYVKDIHVGDKVDVMVESLAGRKLSGVISRTSQKVDEDTRTMTAEIEVANPELELVPGMYAQVIIQAQRRPEALAIPIESVVQEREPSVYVVNATNQIELRPVKLGLETATRYEVLSGLTEGELVLIGGRTKVIPGQQVETKLVGPLAQ